MTVAPSFNGERQYVLEESIQGQGNKKYHITVDQSQYTGYIAGPLVSVREVDSNDVECALRKLMTTPIYICPEPVLGLDGTTTTVTISQGMNTVTFSWWGDIPKQWINLVTVLELFEK